MLERRSLAATEDEERQIAIGVVVAVEEAAFLMPVERVVRGVEIQDDLPGGRACASRNTSANTLWIAAPSCPTR